MVPALAGKEFTVTAKVDVSPWPQPFDPLTVIFPDWAVGPKFTVMFLVVLDPDAPFGNVHT